MQDVLTTTVFNAAIMACSRARELEDGMFLLREMLERKVARDVWTYNSAMSLCKNVGEWTRAVRSRREQGEGGGWRVTDVAARCKRSYRYHT